MAPKRKLTDSVLSALPLTDSESAAAAPQGEAEGSPPRVLEAICLSREMVPVPDMVQAQVTPSSSPPLLVASGELARVAAKQRAKPKVVKSDRIKGLAQWMRIEVLVCFCQLSLHLPSDALHIPCAFQSDASLHVLQRCGRRRR